MKTNVLTNVLLAVIALLLMADLLARAPVARVEADTFKLDNCITEKPGDKPAAYVHVIQH